MTKYRAAFLITSIIFLSMASVVAANHYLGYKWGNSQVQNLKVYDATTTPEMTVSVAQAVAEWNKSSVVEMTIVRVPGQCAIRRGAISVCEMPPCSGWSMNASLNGTKIVSAYVSLSVAGCNGEQNDAVSRQTAACHEIGHAIGLDHRDYGQPSCMAGFDGGPLPDAHDYEELEAIY